MNVNDTETDGQIGKNLTKPDSLDVPEQRAARPEEIAESRRKCWGANCNRTARLEWCGWRYCIPHFWTYVLRDAPSWRHKLVKLRWTEIARH